jgi:hypothetical protein
MSVSVKREVDWTFYGNFGPKATKLLPLLLLAMSKYIPNTAVQSDPTLHFFVFCLYILMYLTLTLSPPLKEAKIGGFGGLQFLGTGDQGIAASPCINHFVRNFTANPMVKFRMF